MKHQQNQSIEQLILETLQEGTISIIELIERISVIRLNTTKQGIYRVLRKLTNEEKIVIHRKSVSLNLHWIKKMNEFFSIAHFHYSQKAANTTDFLNIQEKDKIVYFFKNLNMLDSFMNHAFHMFTVISNPEKPILVYNPHEWFAYARQETEDTLIKTLRNQNRQLFITVTHNDPLDQALKKKFQSDLLQYNITNKKIFAKTNYYLNVFDDYLIEVFIDPQIANQIDEFFKKTTRFDDESRDKLAEIVSKNGKNKLVISRNKKKAEKYTKILSKDFYLLH